MRCHCNVVWEKCNITGEVTRTVDSQMMSLPLLRIGRQYAKVVAAVDRLHLWDCECECLVLGCRHHHKSVQSIGRHYVVLDGERFRCAVRLRSLPHDAHL